MKLVKPSFEILTPINREEVLRKIEAAGRTILQQRCSPAAHPQMREIMCPVQEIFHDVLPELF